MARPASSPATSGPTEGNRSPDAGPWEPPRTSEDWMESPVRGAVIEIGYGGPDEYNDPPYPSVEDLARLHDLGARVVALEFQYAWTISPPYLPDEAQFSLVTDTLDNVAAAGLFAILAVRNGPGGGTDDRQPNWSPDGDRILFQRHTPASENWDIYTIASDGSSLQQVTTSPLSDTDASWSPDGHWIVYSSDDGGLLVPNILIIPADGGDPIRVTYEISNEDGAPSWSPDGQWIAFESHPGQDEDSPSALWLIAVP